MAEAADHRHSNLSSKRQEDHSRDRGMYRRDRCTILGYCSRIAMAIHKLTSNQEDTTV